jgi:hypothetical protein
MAQRRMFSPKITSSDAFLDMPISSQLLYFHLGMDADDDGFVNPKRIMRIIGVGDDDLKILLAKRFVLLFESGVIVIKHWKINNLIRKDWHHNTVYIEEKAQLQTKDNGAYTEKDKSVNRLLTDNNIIKLNIIKPIDKSIGGSKLPSPKQEAKEFFDLTEKQEQVIHTLTERGIPEKICRAEISQFVNYWSELNGTGKKQRWEMEKTFELNRRLAKWFNNYQKWNMQKNKAPRGVEI